MNGSKPFSKILALALSFFVIYGAMPMTAQTAGDNAIAISSGNNNNNSSSSTDNGVTINTTDDDRAMIRVGDGSATFDKSGTVSRGLTGIDMGTYTINTYTVPRDVTLTVPAGETFTIATGVTLVNRGTITNNGTINNQGTITNQGAVTNTAGSTYIGAIPEGGIFVPLQPTVTTTSLPDGKVGTPYSQTLAATSITSITWTVARGLLPDGLTLSTDGIISGTPTVARKFEFTVRAANAGGNETKELSIKIAPSSNGGIQQPPDDVALITDFTIDSSTAVDAAPAEPEPDTASNNVTRIILTVGETSYTVNGSNRTMDAAPVIIGNRTMVPLRFIAEALGAEVSWNGETRTAIVNLDDTTLYVTIGELTLGMDVPAVIINERTMAPLRYISESLGAEVDWDPDTGRIDISQ